MSTQAKKKFPGIFIIVGISFIVYLTVVSIVIYVHYIKKPADIKSNKNIATPSTSAGR